MWHMRNSWWLGLIKAVRTQNPAHTSLMSWTHLPLVTNNELGVDRASRRHLKMAGRWLPRGQRMKLTSQFVVHRNNTVQPPVWRSPAEWRQNVSRQGAGWGHRKKLLCFRGVILIPLQQFSRRDTGPDSFKGGGAMAGWENGWEYFLAAFFHKKNV